MIKIDTTNRSDADEIMDDFLLGGNQLEDALVKIAKINKWLGGNKTTIDGVSKLLNDFKKDQLITIYDLGCGNGDMLRSLSKFADQNNYNFELIGVDANENTVDFARKLSVNYPKISYLSHDIFDEKLCENPMDIALFTLTLHHFKDAEIENILSRFSKCVKVGIVINDLERSALAYRLFQTVTTVFNIAEMPKKDGLVSILRGFKRIDLENFQKKLNLKNSIIQWKWAFRYQWIISKA